MGTCSDIQELLCYPRNIKPGMAGQFAVLFGLRPDKRLTVSGIGVMALKATSLAGKSLGVYGVDQKMCK